VLLTQVVPLLRGPGLIGRDPGNNGFQLPISARVKQVDGEWDVLSRVDFKVRVFLPAEKTILGAPEFKDNPQFPQGFFQVMAKCPRQVSSWNGIKSCPARVRFNFPDGEWGKCDESEFSASQGDIQCFGCGTDDRFGIPWGLADLEASHLLHRNFEDRIPSVDKVFAIGEFEDFTGEVALFLCGEDIRKGIGGKCHSGTE